MDQWLSSILSVFVRDLVCGAVDQFRYPCCYNNFVEELQDKENKLIATRNIVKDRVKHAKKQAIRNDVLDSWLEEASPLRDNMDDLLRKARTDKSCCFGRCPNWIWRYRLAKKLAAKKVLVEKCIDEGKKFIQFERVASFSVSDVQRLPSEKCLKFDSRQYAYEQLTEALEDDEVTMIGLYGMAGSGKTTMAMELVRIVEAEHLFDKVIFVPVSSKVEVRKIQDKIASVLQFHFPEDGDRERAQRLWTRLTIDDERTLVILDDVWQLLDFDDIGVPSGENNRNCKVLITTRSDAVCTLMDCQRMIHLSILTDEEAWDLFQKQAHISEGTSNTLKQLGRQISNKCKGLPVAIVALASTLKGKAEDEWNVALDRLRSSILVNIEKGLQNPYTCIQVSYDNLDTEEAKSLFLLCSAFPEDFEIPVETLIRVAIGLGLVGEVRSLEGARNEVNAAKNKLISCCLLSTSNDDNERECVKMHDLVRNVALWIAKNENKVVKCALERDANFKCNSIRYLWCRKFPNDLDCSSIEFLSIKTDLDIPNEMFEGMVRLKVLFLSWEGILRTELSMTRFKSLTSLRFLSLEWWELADISFVGHMKKLESLTLHLCSFFELPDVVIAQLANLRLLHLSRCDMKKNPFEVIGRHPLLEELYFYESGFDNGDHTEFFKKFIVPQALQRYQIKLGPEFKDCEKEILNAHRTLILSCFDTTNAVVVNLAKNAEVLLVANIKGGGKKNILPDIFQIERGGVTCYGWIELWLCDSEKIECLVDTRNHSQEVRTLLFELRKLRIERMENLGALYHGVLPSGLFEKLEQLCIYKCPLLTSLFIPAVARNLVHLEKLEVVACDGLRHVLEIDDTKEGEISRQDDMLVFSKLKQLHISGCSMLEYTIPVTFAHGLVELESLEICECYEMKYLFRQCTRGDQGQSELKIELPALEKLRLTSNSNMISIFPEVCCATWPSLHEFYLWDCPEFDIAVNNFNASSWEDVRDIEKHFITSETSVIYNSNVDSIFSLDGLRMIREPVNLRLRYLRLSYLYQMKYICVGLKNSFTFQNLKTLEIYGCEKVEVIFPTSVLRCLPELERLEITECQELRQIIEEDEDDDDDVENQRLSNFVSSQPCFPKLAALVVNDCHNLKRLFCVSASNEFPNLELLILWGAAELEELIDGGQGQGGDDHMRKAKVELPKLKFLVLTYLSSLRQEIELPAVTLRVVHDCPKLSLTSSIATLQEFETKLSELEKDLEVDEFYRWKLLKMVGEIIKSNQVFVSGDTRVENLTEEAITTYFPIGPEEQASCSEVCATLSFDIEGGIRKKLVGEVTNSYIPSAVATSPPELLERTSTSHLDFSLHNAHSHSPKKEVEERATSLNAKLVTFSTHPESARRRQQQQQNPLFNSQGKSYQHTKIRLRQTEIYIDKESKGHPINIKESEDDDPTISLVQAIEEDGDGQIILAPSSVSIFTEEHHATEDDFVVKVISELEESLKVPLKDIASSEANALRLLTALKFLSQLPLEDITLPGGLKAVIDSLHREFPSILRSFKQAFAATHKSAVPEEQGISIEEGLIGHRSEEEIKAKEKEEINGCEAELSSLDEGNKECIVKTKGFKMEFENVSRDNSQMMEVSRKARRQLFEVNYKWSALCSQFELNRIAATSPSEGLFLLKAFNL